MHVMKRTAAAVLALALVVSALAVVPAALAQQTEQPAENAAAPGAQLSGAVGVQGAELDGEVETRSYGIRIAQADSDAERAAIVAEQYDRTNERVGELRERRAALDAARDNGSMSDGEYRARIATLHAESQSAARLANRTSETASGLPAALLESKGVNATAVRTLANDAADLTGPETAEIARGIAGDRAGERPGEAGQRDRSDRAGNVTAAPTDAGPTDEDTVTVVDATDRRPDSNETDGSGAGGY